MDYDRASKVANTIGNMFTDLRVMICENLVNENDWYIQVDEKQ